MKGLLLKDFYIIRDSAPIMVLTMVIIGVALAVLSSPWLLVAVVAASLSTAAVTTISNDKITHWDQFSATLPVSRKQIISSKYCMYLLLGLVGMLLGAIISITMSVMNHDFEISALILHVCLGIILSLLPGSINIPLSYLLDAEKGIVGLMLSYVLTAGALAGVSILLSRLMNMEESMLLLYGIVAAFSIVAYLISWRIVPNIMSRKDM